VTVLQEGLSLDDKQKDLYFQLGVVYEKQQRFDEAVRTFRKVLQLDPKHAESYNYIGYMYAEKGINLPEAVDLIQKALAIEPENGYFIDSLGWAYYQQGRYPEALRELQRAVNLAKDDPVLYDHLADAYSKNGMTAEAIAAWERSLQVDPKGPTADAVQKKLNEARDNQMRVKGGAPKAEQK
jgi:tetratricopeptide (TPR) repeat protein